MDKGDIVDMQVTVTSEHGNFGERQSAQKIFIIQWGENLRTCFENGRLSRFGTIQTVTDAVSLNV